MIHCFLDLPFFEAASGVEAAGIEGDEVSGAGEDVSTGFAGSAHVIGCFDK